MDAPLLVHTGHFLLQVPELAVLLIAGGRLQALPLPLVEPILANTQTLRHFGHGLASLGDLRHRVPSEIATEICFAHQVLLASKLRKKASTDRGAIHYDAALLFVVAMEDYCSADQEAAFPSTTSMHQNHCFDR